MNKSKLSNPVRLIAFFLTSVILICTFGFAVDGWQIKSDATIGQIQSSPTSPAPDAEQNGGDTDGNNSTDDELSEPEIIIPKYYNPITGLECSEKISTKTHLAFVMNSDLPIYGLSSADLVCEIPTEEGTTRMCVFISDTDNLWKIGSITKTRGYISNVISYFGGICISSGKDDTLSYNSCDISGRYIDLLSGNYQYTEFTSNVYTNKELLENALQNSNVDNSSKPDISLPYIFNDVDEDEIIFDGQPATRITITQSSSCVSELKFNRESGCYLFYKNGMVKTDAINNKGVEYKNCFVLFADSITYDNATCSQMIMDTIGSGRGYYFTNGSYAEIFWTASIEDGMNFYSLGGEKLAINRGTTYISFLKSSRIDKLFYE